MGDISKRLHKKLASKSKGLPTKEPHRRPGEPLPAGVRDIPTLIKEGVDPIHAAYAFMQQMTSHFAEGVSQFSEMRAFAQIAGDAQDEYLPSGPPMSPLTLSYFNCWMLYDLRFGKDGDTIGKCQIDANDILWFSTDQLDALETLSESRMGIYEHVGMDGIHVRLRELVTGDDITCLSASGYRGEVGELWYARLLPSLVPELVNYHVVFTTPYILIHSTKDDWLQFLKRSILELKGGDERQRLHRLLKYGLGTHFWNEFVFKSYHHHQTDAVFLAGIPDITATLPHA